MDSAAVLRSFIYSASAVSHVRSVLERPCMFAAHNAMSISHTQGLAFSKKLVSNPVKRGGMIVSCIKKSETTGAVKSDVLSDSQPHRSLKTNYQRRATLPNGLEALVMEVCDETEVTELKLKVGDFEMHLKRNVGVTESPVPAASPPPPPPLESSPASSTPPTPPRSSTETNNPFTNVSVRISAKLAALEASGTSGYVLVLSKTVGSFRRSRTVKGNKRPPTCEEGDSIKEGHVIGYVEECGTELPVKSDVAGKVLKLLVGEGEAVGYGDPIVAVLPSFQGAE
ncbi:Pyruvate carboxylase subunit B like [Actinidia chinensis var. chinensis]|uniref:Pyruvate carboxylase subunit B like n=1 Tax=Actinidia chinensis var. chinensis TaxID=1590841 RepID=A0A2R6PLM9_ACTCC|nr:Pyruvate carboxylase subunit B like [Actinidia chinensis var. chinensis]